jgi:hypothetical protein
VKICPRVEGDVRFDFASAWLLSLNEMIREVEQEGREVREGCNSFFPLSPLFLFMLSGARRFQSR